MGTIKTIKEFLRFPSKTTKQSLSLQTKQTGDPFNSQAFGDSTSGRELFRNDKEEAQAYVQLSWVAVAVDALIRDGSNRKIKYEDDQGKPIETARVDSRITDPIQLGFAGLSFGELMKQMIGLRALTGNAFFLKTVKSAFGLVNDQFEQFTPMLAGEVQPIISNSGITLLGYEVTFADGRRRTVQPEELIHFSQNRILNRYLGVGNIEKMRTTAEAEASGERFAASFMKNKAQPSLIITDETVREAGDMDRITKLLEKKFQGSENAGKIIYLSGEGVDAKAFQITQKDMQFLEVKQFTMKTTLAIFGVIPEAVGVTDNSNRATIGPSLLKYFENINRLLEDLESTINTQHVHLIDPNVFLRFQKYPTGDVENLVKLINNAVITPNDASRALGQSTDDDDEGRNSFYLPLNLVPLSSDVAESVDQNSDPDGDFKVVDLDELDTIESDDPSIDFMNPKNFNAISDRFVKSATRPKRFQVRFLRTSLKTRSELEDRFTPSVARFFEDQGKRFIQDFNDQFNKVFEDLEAAQIVNNIFIIEAEAAILRKAIRPLHTSGVQRGIGDLNKTMNASVNPNLSNQFVNSSINRMGRLITGGILPTGVKVDINETTRKSLVNVIAKGVEESLTVTEISDRIQDKFDQFQGFRARRIARTESRIAYDEASRISYSELGIPTYDVVGCESFDLRAGGDEIGTGCGLQDVPITKILAFHPNHIGVMAPSKQP